MNSSRSRGRGRGARARPDTASGVHRFPTKPTTVQSSVGSSSSAAGQGGIGASKKSLPSPSQSEVQQILEEHYQRLLGEINKSGNEFSSAKLATALNSFATIVEGLKKLDWSVLIDKVLQVLKNCLVFQHAYNSKLDQELYIFNEIGHPSFSNPGQQQRIVNTIVNQAFTLLQKILSLLSPKGAFNMFVSLMSKTPKSDYTLVTFLENRDLIHNFHIVPEVNLSEILKFLMATIRKAKCTLSHGERKVLAYNNVPYTSFSASAVRFLDDLCIFLMNTVQSPIADLDIEEVFDALLETVAAAPFLSMSLDQDVLRRLILLASNSAGENSVIPRHLILGLMTLVLKVEWGREDLTPNISRTQFQKSAVTFANDIISTFIMDVDTNSVPIGNALQEIKTAEAGIGVLVSCADHHFQDFVPIALHCFGLVAELLSLESKFGPLWYSGKHYRNRKGLTAAMTIQHEKACSTLVIRCLIFVKSITKQFGIFLKDNEENNDCKATTDQFLEMWYNYLSKSKLFETPNMEILATLVDCFSSLNEILFEQFTDKQRVFCIVNALGYSRHGSDLVRSKAARAIALFLEFKCLVQDDVQFLLDCLETIDSEIVAPVPDAVSTKVSNSGLVFSWATSNLCDALAKYYSQSDNPSLDWNVYNRIYQLVMRLDEDHPKMKYNANRAMGALILWTPVHFLEESMLQNYVITIASKLSSQLGAGGDFKARWNASHALGCIIRKTEIWNKFHSDLSEIILPAFLRALKLSDNFKERVYCLKALQSIRDRNGYSKYFREIWTIVMEAFNANPESKVPIHHGMYENYKEEVARSIMHLAALTDPGKDLAVSGQLESIFIANYETLVEAHSIIESSNNKDEMDEAWLIIGVKNIGDIIKLI